jgi:6,7-dimethyl-8-ribityllumazine synthase
MSKHISHAIPEGLPELPGVHVHLGSHAGQGKRFGIVAARFNPHLTGALLTSALDVFEAHGVRRADVEVVWVPGSFEIPLFVQRLAKTGRFDAIIAIGAVIEGETRHAELILHGLSQALVRLSLEFDCPVLDAVVSARTIAQADARCLSGSNSRGAHAALAALETASHPKQFT